MHAILEITATLSVLLDLGLQTTDEIGLIMLSLLVGIETSSIAMGFIGQTLTQLLILTQQRIRGAITDWRCGSRSRNRGGTHHAGRDGTSRAVVGVIARLATPTAIAGEGQTLGSYASFSSSSSSTSSSSCWRTRKVDGRWARRLLEVIAIRLHLKKETAERERESERERERNV